MMFSFANLFMNIANKNYEKSLWFTTIDPFHAWKVFCNKIIFFFSSFTADQGSTIEFETNRSRKLDQSMLSCRILELKKSNLLSKKADFYSPWLNRKYQLFFFLCEKKFRQIRTKYHETVTDLCVGRLYIGTVM